MPDPRSEELLAHGIGGAQDLPIPLEFFVVGGTAALAISFIVLIVAWREPRYDASVGGRELPAGFARFADGPVLAWSLRAVGLAFFLYVAWAALAGEDLLVNPTFGVFYVLLWVGVVPASLLFGPFYRAVNPVRTLYLLFAKAVRFDPDEGLVRLPSWVGYWPAALGLFAFVWLELVHPRSTYLTPVVVWVGGYVVLVFFGAVLFGSRWVAQADPFEAYSTWVGHLSVFGRRMDGTLVLRSPLANLDGLTPAPGLVAAVAVLLGSTAFDSFADSSTWVSFTQSSSVSSTVLDTGMLLAFCLVVALTFSGATMLTGIDHTTVRSRLPSLFAHSVVPIIVGYIVAHYLSYFVEVGQQTLVLLSDPLSRGDDFLGTADYEVSYWLSQHPTFLAVTKVTAVVTGHVLGVVAAHDRAVRLLPRDHQVTGQLGLLLVMVFYTVSGLYLLFGS
jgi:hypothetical protein